MPEDMVAVKVGDEQLAEGKSDPVPHHLALGALPAIEEEDFTLAMEGLGGDVPVYRRAGSAGAEKGE